jgi:hypothetical protein
MAPEEHNDHDKKNDPAKGKQPRHSQGNSSNEDHGDKLDLKKVQDKYNELKAHPKVKATENLFANYFVEIFYLAAAIISYIISLFRQGSGGFVFIGIGFLVGIFLFSVLKRTSHQVSSFLTKQELVVHIIIAIILLILACIIPTIMVGILIGIPAGFGIRHWLSEVKSHHGGGDSHHQ